jgi:SAM-dependent methyltransferase
MTDFWDERYGVDDYVFGEAPNAFLASRVDDVRRHRRALAVADGEGRNGVWLAEQGLEVTSLDASRVGLAKARKLAEKRGVDLTTVQTDLAEYAWPERAFDLVVGIFIQFADPPLRRAIFSGMERTLTPGGTLLLEGYRPEQIGFGTGGPRQVEKMYTRELLQEAFAGLEILYLREYDAEIAEGGAHNGLSALIDLVARKRT